MSVETDKRPNALFPLVRHLSCWSTRVLYRTPATPNQITAVSLIFGLAAAWMFLGSGRSSALAGAGFLLVCYVLDNSDGEIARLKNLASDFGQRFDTFVDWVVHAAMFVALGIGISERTGQDFWLWFGLAAALGGTINYGLDTMRDSGAKLFDGQARMVEDGPSASKADRTAFASRVVRTDFCFIVLVLALADSMWVLLPTGAVGAQVYWMLQFAKGFRRHHV
jgi:phosphatidylglycerophosphate synthase